MRKFFVLALLCALICSCGSDKKVVGDVKNLYGKWFIEEAMNSSTADAEERPYISFEKDGKMNGCASVNLFFGDYKFDGKNLKLGNVGMTRKMGASMEVEDAVSEALGKSLTIKIDGEKAQVFDKSGKIVMTLVKDK